MTNYTNCISIEKALYFDLFDDIEDFDSDEVKSFLNEYYLIFPDRLPDVDFF